MQFEKDYLALLNRIMSTGERSDDRTGTGTYSLFAEQLSADVSGFSMPILTTKKIFWRGIVEEVLWIMRGETNVRILEQRGVNVWSEWADEKGELGPLYGKQYRNGPTDQIFDCIELLVKDPSSRRNVVSAWNVAEVGQMRLHPCLAMFQVRAYQENGPVQPIYNVDMHIYQRSADIFLGVPFNFGQMALVLHLLCNAAKQFTDREYLPRKLTFSYGDVHLYRNHIDQAITQLSREPITSPRLQMGVWESDKWPIYPWEWISDQLRLLNYEHHGSLPAPVAV